MALAPITITAGREENIDFSKPFMDFSLSLIMQKPGEPPINNFAFLQPFTGGVWLSTIGVVSPHLQSLETQSRYGTILIKVTFTEIMLYLDENRKR